MRTPKVGDVVRLKTHQTQSGQTLTDHFTASHPVGTIGFVCNVNVDGWLTRVRTIPSGRETNWGQSFEHYWEYVDG